MANILCIEFSAGDIVAIVVAIMASLTSIFTIRYQVKIDSKEQQKRKATNILCAIYGKIMFLINNYEISDPFYNRIETDYDYCLAHSLYLSDSVRLLVNDIFNSLRKSLREEHYDIDQAVIMPKVKELQSYFEKNVFKPTK